MSVHDPRFHTLITVVHVCRGRGERYIRISIDGITSAGGFACPQLHNVNLDQRSSNGSVFRRNKDWILFVYSTFDYIHICILHMD